MATKTIIESPAGEPIEILDDKSWAELCGVPMLAVRQFSGSKPWILRALYEHGAFEDKSGLASTKLVDYANSYPGATKQGGGKIQMTGINSIYNSQSSIPAFERKLNGKRCYSIKLVAMPKSWLEKLEKLRQKSPGPKTVEEPVAATVEIVSGVDTEWNAATSEWQITDESIQELLDSVPGPDAPTIFEAMPAMDLNIASQVAMSLLTTVVEIITAGDTGAVDERVKKLQGDFSEVSQRLSQRLTENDSLRRQLRTAGEEIRALRYERDGLRARLRATEANLTAALKGDAVRAINGEIQKRVDAIMRVAPTSNKGE